MADSFDLGLAFVRTHPADAARVLEALPTGEACALFEAIPGQVGAPVLAAMLPTAAARIVSELPPACADATAAHIGAQSIVAILRHVSPEQRTRLLAELPAASAVTVRMLLGFPEDAIGAWVDPRVLTVTANDSVATALARVRSSDDADAAQVFVVDAEQRLVGSIALHVLLRADPNLRSGTLAKPASPALPAMMPLASARATALWDRALALPVLDRDQRLVGVLRRATLSRAMRGRGASANEHDRVTSVTGALAHTYWGVVSGSSAAALAALPRVKRVLPQEP